MAFVQSSQLVPTIEYGSHLLYGNQTQARIDAFYINCIVNSTSINESFVYRILNPTLVDINLSTRFPLSFTSESVAAIQLKSIEFRLDSYSLNYNLSTITNVDDFFFPNLIPIYFNVTLPLLANSTSTLSIQICREWSNSFISHLKYWYSSESIQAWKQSDLSHGEFSFKYQDKYYRSVTYNIPNVVLKKSPWFIETRSIELSSKQENWDGNAVYFVNINTGINYFTNYTIILINIGVFLGLIAFIITSIILIKKNWTQVARKQKKR